MQRVSQVLSDLCVKRLIEAKTKLSSSTLNQNLSYRNSFKYALIHDAQIRIEINSATSFSIYEGESELPSIEGEAILEARLTDFLLGATRVKTQYQDLLKAKSAHSSNAWLVVTAYYCGFFACTEVLKVLNRIPLGFDVHDLETMEIRATGAQKADFFSGKPLNFLGQHRANKLVFESSGAKPHQYAWSQLIGIIKEAFDGKDWPEVEALKRMLSDPLLNPSKIRNNWNYKRADYYGATGEKFGMQSKKLIGNLAGSTEWILRNGMSAAPDDSSRIAALCEILTSAIIDAHDRIKIAV